MGMIAKQVLVWCLLLLITHSSGCEKFKNLTEVKIKMEEKVINLANALTKHYSNVCQDSIQKCELKTYDICEGTGERHCFNNFPTLSKCVLKPGLRVANISGVRLPNIMKKMNLSDETRRFICASTFVEPVFEQLRVQNNKDYTFAYIGSRSGAVRVSPGFKQLRNSTSNHCENYDPRKRPWYVSAITGSKTTIILFDISRTMVSVHPGVRFINAKVTLQIIFGTLNSFDYVGVVVFSKSARTLFSGKIIKATAQNKQMILQQIKNLDVDNSGSTNYTSGIEAGIKMIDGVETLCGENGQTVFLLLTDGDIESDEVPNVSDIDSYVNSQYKRMGKNVDNMKLISFVYGVQANIHYKFPRELTCLYDGILFRIQDGVDEFGMVEKLSTYYIFLSKSISKDLVKPVWSEFYEDAFGFGKIVTVTMPVYSDENMSRVVGVVGIDILASQLLNCGYSSSYLDSTLRGSPRCFKSILSPQQLQFLQCRQQNVSCSQKSCNNTTKTTEQLCASTITNEVFYNKPVDSSEDIDKCCGLTINQFIIIILSVLSFLLSIFIGVLLYKNRVIQRIINYFRKETVSVREETDDTAISLLGDHNLMRDPAKKYKMAEEDNIKIYRQEQFSL